MSELAAAEGVGAIVDMQHHPFGNSYFPTTACGGAPYDADIRHCFEKRCTGMATPPSDCFAANVSDIVVQHGPQEAIFNRASRGAASARDSVGAAETELKQLRDAAVAAEVEMLRGRTALERAAKGLKALARRTRRDAVAVEDALEELRRLPSAAAVSARADAVMTANQVAKVRRGVDAALQGVWRAGVQI